MSQHANPAELDRAAAQLQQGISQLERIQRTVQAAMNRTDWHGIAGDSLRTEIQALQNKIDTARRELHAMAVLLRGGADVVRSHASRGEQATYVGQTGAAVAQRARLVERQQPAFVSRTGAGVAGRSVEEMGTHVETTSVGQAGQAAAELAARTESVDLGQAGLAATHVAQQAEHVAQHAAPAVEVGEAGQALTHPSV